MNYNHCKECKGKHECNQPLTGFKDGIRCKYNLRGYYNDKEILKDKYKKFECANLDQIKKHINSKHSIYLYGEYGKGKTHFSKWAANKYNLKGHNVYLQLSADVIKSLKEEIQHNKSTGEYKISLTDTMCNIEILFIDDIGNERMTDFVHECMSIVIDDRCRNEKPTYVTSNYSIEKLYNVWATQIGKVKAGQLCSRLKTFGEIQIEGRNHRK